MYITEQEWKLGSICGEDEQRRGRRREREGHEMLLCKQERVLRYANDGSDNFLHHDEDFFQVVMKI